MPQISGPTSNELEGANVNSVKGQVWKQQMLLQELAQDLSGEDGQHMDDAVYFLREAREALDKLGG